MNQDVISSDEYGAAADARKAAKRQCILICRHIVSRLILNRMRRIKRPASSVGTLVGIAADGASSYGRALMRGAMQYVNAQRRWEIHTVLRRTFEPKLKWPKCDGAIIAGVGNELTRLISAQSRHVVSCSGAADPSVMPVACADDEAVGAMAAEHLMECRLDTFSFYGIPTAINSQKREHGFAAALARNNHKLIPCPVGYPAMDLDSLPHWPQLTEWLCALPKPIGIMAVDDTAAMDLAAACRHSNIGVPENIAIIGVNNDDLICESAWSPLSSVDCGFVRIGYAAARLLDQMLSGVKLKAEERHIRLPPLQVVTRLSTDILAVDDPDVADTIRYIREHACDPCTVGNVLRHIPRGRRWLERQFANKIGRSPREEIARVQMETAKRLLLQPSPTLPEIAARCGFSCSQAFGRAFLRSVGNTPAAYRRGTQRESK